MMRVLLTFTLALGGLANAQTTQTSPQTTNAQGSPYKPGDFQNGNANYPARNPFYFEGRVDWDLLKIDQPSNAWEFAQRGIHYQDDLKDTTSAIADYQKSISLNSLQNGTCQLIKSAPAGFGQNVNPPPCMFTVRMRLANLLEDSDSQTAVGLFQEVLRIDPLRLGVNTMIGETYTKMAQAATDDGGRADAYNRAVQAYQAELALSPVTALSISLTGDQANNAHVHWALADIYRTLGRASDQASELDLYLKATRQHSDTYAWRIQLAQKRLQQLQSVAP
jgi:tetratricopeptide (TPR) repeat protein